MGESVTRHEAYMPSGSQCSLGKYLATSSGRNEASIEARFQMIRCAASELFTTSQL